MMWLVVSDCDIDNFVAKIEIHTCVISTVSCVVFQTMSVVVGIVINVGKLVVLISFKNILSY